MNYYSFHKLNEITRDVRNVFVSKIEPFFNDASQAFDFEEQMFSYFLKYVKHDLKKCYDLCTLQVVCDLHIKGQAEVLENIIMGNIVWRHDFIKDDVDEVEEIRDYITKAFGSRRRCSNLQKMRIQEGIFVFKTNTWLR